MAKQLEHLGILTEIDMAAFAGYFFYLTRRVSGSNALNSILHGLFDFALISGSVILLDQTSYVGAIAPILAYPIIAIVLLVKRHKIEPSQTTDNHTIASST